MTKQTHQKAGESRALLAGVLGGGSPAQIFKASDGSTYPEKKILIQWKPAASLHKRDNQASLNKRDNQTSLNKRDNQATKIILKITHLYIERLMLQEN